MGYRSTREVAQLLGVNPSRIMRATWDQRLTPPKGPGGAYLWGAADIARAARLFGCTMPTLPEAAGPTGGAGDKADA